MKNFLECSFSDVTTSFLKWTLETQIKQLSKNSWTVPSKSLFIQNKSFLHNPGSYAAN